MKKVLIFLVCCIGLLHFNNLFAFDFVSSPVGYQSSLSLDYNTTYSEPNNYISNCAEYGYDRSLSYTYGTGSNYMTGLYVQPTGVQSGGGISLKTKYISSVLDLNTIISIGGSYKYFTAFVGCGPYTFSTSYNDFLFNKTNGKKLDMIYPFFMNGNSIIRIEGTNIVWYTLDTTTMLLGSAIQTIDMISRFGHNLAIYPGTHPIFYNISGVYFWIYQGSDGKSYQVALDTTNSDTPLTVAGTGSVLPLGNFLANDMILARQTAGSGSMFSSQITNLSTYVEMSTGYVLSSLNLFENPIAYFTESGGGVIKWDMNCTTPGYDSCSLNGGVFKCTNSIGTLSPGGQTCGGTVNPINPGTSGNCHDGILNQNEVTVDYGGVCGNPEYTVGELTCKVKNIVSVPNVGSGGLHFGNLSSVAYDERADSITFDFYDVSPDREDYFSAYGLSGSTSFINTGTLLSLNNTGASSYLYSSNPSNQNNMNIEIFSFSGTSQNNITYVAFKTNKNSANQGTVLFKNTTTGKQISSSLVGIGGGIAVAYSRDGFIATSVIVTALASPFVFQGFEIGSTIETKQEFIDCRNSQWACSWNYLGNICSPTYYYGKARGTCGSGPNVCMPNQLISEADWTYASEPTSKPPIVIDTATQDGELDTGSDIFSCNETGFAVLICPFQIIARIWEKLQNLIKVIANFLEAIVTIGSPAGIGEIIGFFSPSIAHADDLGASLVVPWMMTPTGGLKADSAPTFTGSDIAGFNFAILSAGDSLKNSDNGGIKGIFAMSQWLLILFSIVVIIIMLVLAIKG